MSLRDALKTSDGVVAPGVFDPLTALFAEQAGFTAVYVSGASVSYSSLGRPDLGFVSLDQLTDIIRRMRQRVSAHLIVDADTGFGNAINVKHTVQSLERAGASAIQIEDQKAPKRCGHLRGKQLIDADEMVGKVKSALDARVSADTLIMARTDAIAVEGLEAALDRAEAYKEAGADILFVEAPRSIDDLSAIAARFADSIPLLANLVDDVEPQRDSIEKLQNAGFKLVITAGSLARVLTFAADQFFQSLMADGSTAAFQDRRLSFDALNQRLGLPEMLALADEYAQSGKRD